MIGKSANNNIGLSAVISVGNKADIDEADLIEYLGNDEGTRVILMYIEGLRNGRKFINALKKLPPDKYVVAIKAGKSKHGAIAAAIAAASHTGSLAGSDNVFNGIAKQLGIIRAENVREAFNFAMFLSQAKTPGGENVVIITNGGGIGVMAADACEEYGLKIFDDYENLKETFEKVIPPFGSWKNPVDLTGQASAADYEKALEKALINKNIHAVISLYCETALFDQRDIVELIKKMNEKYKNRKPIVFSLFGGEKIDEVIEKLSDGSIKVFDEVYDAVSAMGALYRRYRYIKEMEKEPEIYIEEEEKIREIIRLAKKDGRKILLPHEAKEIAKLIGIDVSEYKIAKNLDEAVRYSEEIGYPVVMKIVSEDIVHKTDAGGVALDLENKEEIINAYQVIMRNAKTYFPNAKIRGVEISKMVSKGVETIVGGMQDPAFGPIVVFGLGGIYVEAIGDVSFRAAPLGIREAKRMVNEISSSKILYGVRGEARRDIEKISQSIVNIGKLMARVKEIKDMEINPLVVYEYGKGVKAVDVRILLRD